MATATAVQEAPVAERRITEEEARKRAEKISSEMKMGPKGKSLPPEHFEEINRRFTGRLLAAFS